MAITYPRTLFSDTIWDQWDLNPRPVGQGAQSKFGITRWDPKGKDRWFLQARSDLLDNETFLDLQTWIDSLIDSDQVFRAYDVKFPRPRLHMAASVAGGTGTIVDDDTLTISDLVPGITLRIGDKIGWSEGGRRHLHMALEDANTGAGTTLTVDVAPRLLTELTTGTFTVDLDHPTVEMKIIPGSVSSPLTGFRNRISFSAEEVLEQ
jgi:hypothetical protein